VAIHGKTENSHIGAFLGGHGGPGLQHIGLSSLDITSCVSAMIRKQVPFRTPPAAYYRNVRKCDWNANFVARFNLK
jgi:4-hydroxyphenylpyruvate dioxygenase-like putative hemolysin